MTSHATGTSPSLGRRLVGPMAALATTCVALALGLGHYPPRNLRVAAGTGDAVPAAAPAVPAGKPAKPKQKKQQQRLDEAEAFFAGGVVPQIRIELSEADMAKLRANGRADVGGTVRETVGGQETVYQDVAVHIKGGAGSLRPLDDKPGLTLSFDEFAEGQRYHGLEKINLNNGAQDATFMVENLGNALFRDAGLPAARCTNARVWLNGRDLGIYVLKEGFADAFLERFFDEPGGTLYEGGFLKDVNDGLAERVNKNKRDAAKVKELIAAAQDGDAARRRQRLDKVVDVDRFHTFMAMEALTAHWDGYSPHVNNYRVYDDPVTGKLVFLSHGTDQLFQQTDFPLVPANAMLARALTESPGDRGRYLDRLAELRERVVTPANLDRHIDRISAHLAPAMRDVSEAAAKQHAEYTKQLRARAQERVKSIDRQLAAIPRPLKFDAQGYTSLAAAKWEHRPESGNVTIERVTEAGKELVRIRAANGGGGGSLRQSVTLPQGKYVFEADVRLAGVTVADGTPNGGVGLRVSGGRRDAGLTGTVDWRKTEFPIDVTEASRDVMLVAEFRAAAGEAWYDPTSLKLRKQ